MPGTHVNDSLGINSLVLTAVAGGSGATKIEGGIAAVTGSLAITTGLTSILGYVVMPVAATAATANAGVMCTASISGGTLTARRWKHTGATTTTYITATVAGTVSWLAVGT